jgi:hypothetical protein
MNVEIANEAEQFHSGNICFEFSVQCVYCIVGLQNQASLQMGNTNTTYPLRLFNSLCIWVCVAVRWLVARGRNSEARALIQRAAKRNRVTIPDQLIQDMEKTIQLELCQETQGKSYTALDLFRSVGNYLELDN